MHHNIGHSNLGMQLSFQEIFMIHIHRYYEKLMEFIYQCKNKDAPSDFRISDFRMATKIE